jgi:excisionase family DNA binding protein
MKEEKYPLSAEQVSLILNVSEFTVKRLAKDNQLPCIFVSRRPRFSLEKLKEFFQKIEGAPA